MVELATSKTEANGKNSRYSKPHLLSNALHLIHSELQSTHTHLRSPPDQRIEMTLEEKKYKLQFRVRKLDIATGPVGNTVNSCKMFVAESDRNLTSPLCAGSLLAAWGKVILRVISNMIHTNTIPEHSTCVYYWES
jgi:hypothetical protein